MCRQSNRTLTDDLIIIHASHFYHMAQKIDRQREAGCRYISTDETMANLSEITGAKNKSRYFVINITYKQLFTDTKLRFLSH